MNTFRSRFLMVAGLVGTTGLLVNVNCGGGGGGGTGGTGGTTSTGGKGGTSATGGTTGTGGKGGSGTGGGAGTTATGGNGGTTTATGGNGGTSAGGSGGKGSGGSGGNSNTDGGTAQAAFAFTFDKNVEGFGLNTFNPSTGGNLADGDGGTKPTLSWDGTVGSTGSTPTGSLKLDVTFTDYNQFVLISSGTKPLINATGKTATVWVMVDAVDGGREFGGGVQLEANSGASYNGSATGTYTTLSPGAWKAVTLPLTASGSFDPAQIIQFSVNFTTGSRPEGGAFSGPTHAVFHIDTLTDGGSLPAALAPNATFDKNAQGFVIGANTHPDGGPAATLVWDSTTGDPSAGSIQATLPFNAYNQSYTVQSDVAPAADLSGKTLHAKVMLDKVDGGASSIPSGYVILFAQSNGFKYASGSGTGLTAGTWTDVTMTVSTPEGTKTTGYDPTQIIQVGIQIGVGGMPDGGVFGAEIQPKIHIDSIVAQ